MMDEKALREAKVKALKAGKMLVLIMDRPPNPAEARGADIILASGEVVKNRDIEPADWKRIQAEDGHMFHVVNLVKC